MSSHRSAFNATPSLLGIGLISLCLVVTGNHFWQTLLLAGFFVPTGVRTYLVLERRHADGKPLAPLALLDALITSATLALIIESWLLFMIFITAAIKAHDEAIFLIPIILIGLAIWFICLLDGRCARIVPRREALRAKKRQPVRIRLTIRGLLVAVAYIAILLWPIHLWRMRPTYASIASHEAFIAELSLAEAKVMASRADQCRERAAKGAAWESGDEVSEGLKDSPYPGDRPGHSWFEQAMIWDDAAERSRQVARHHQAKSDRYDMRVEAGLKGFR